MSISASGVWGRSLGSHILEGLGCGFCGTKVAKEVSSRPTIPALWKELSKRRLQASKNTSIES